MLLVLPVASCLATRGRGLLEAALGLAVRAARTYVLAPRCIWRGRMTIRSLSSAVKPIGCGSGHVRSSPTLTAAR